WNLIVTALLNICDNPVAGAYGGPLTFRGNSYSLDLSELPVPDSNYRMGGTTLYLLDAIAAICDDGGRDFFVELQGFKIKVRTADRKNQPPLGTIAQAISANTGNVERSEDGLEVRNEVTSSFLVGGDVCDLYQTDEDGAFSFWGYDINGEAILGE